MLLPLKGYPEGYDLTLMNTRYRYPKRNEETGKYDNGSMDLVIKDNVLGTKFVRTIDNPTYQYYMAKDNVPINNYELFLDINKTNMIEVPYKDLDRDIAERTERKEFYYENIKSGNRYLNKQLHTDPRIFFSDSNIEDHYRFRFANSYKNTTFSPTKGYFDIEVDTLHMKGDFPEPGECPINALSYINEENRTVYVFLLRNKENKLISEFEDKLKSGKLIPELKDFIRKAVGGWKNEIRFGLKDLKFQFMMYDEEYEIKLISDFFEAVNLLKPDFMLAWNIAFDLTYIINRILRLGYKPEDIICHPDFKYKEAEYYVDERNANDYAERGDYAKISSYSVWIDQMIQFASRRKGQSEYPNYRLDTIGEIIAKVKKLDYSHITTSIAQLPYINYIVFVFYNIMDTIVQKCIETKTGDVDYLFNKCLVNNTRYAKAHRQTVYLANRGAHEFMEYGFVIGNNNNKWNPKPAEKFPGAFVADPKKLSDYAKYKIDNCPLMVFSNLIDLDYKSLYPSIEREFNMAPNTQIGKVIFPEEIHPNENKLGVEKYTRSTAFMEDFQSHNILEFCTRWLHMPNYETLYNEVLAYFTNIKTPTRPINWYDASTGLRNIFEHYGENAKYTKEVFYKPVNGMINVFDRAVINMDADLTKEIQNGINKH